MSKRYTYSRAITTRDGVETFTADQFDSFDEAQTAVEKGIRDRRLQLKKTYVPELQPEQSPVESPRQSTTLNAPNADHVVPSGTGLAAAPFRNVPRQ